MFDFDQTEMNLFIDPPLGSKMWSHPEPIQRSTWPTLYFPVIKSLILLDFLQTYCIHTSVCRLDKG